MDRHFLYHFHGLGHVDFSEMTATDLETLEGLAEQRELEILPTVYLRRPAMNAFVDLMHAFDTYRTERPSSRIRGFAIEGPMLGPDGGIPRSGVWTPTVDEWRELAALGRSGLRYIVMAPDAMELDDEVGSGFTFADLLLDFYENGTRVALGHFHHGSPELSARRMRDVISFLHKHYESSPYLVLTDHLYNDMPRNFRHAYRTADELAHREEELPGVVDVTWTREALSQLLGPVPAGMITAAEDGKLFPCINFDGFHVDLDIVKKTVEFLGADKLIVLTDHTEVATMALEQLTNDGSKLWRRNDGKVAAGMSGPDAQTANMRSIGLTPEQIEMVFWTNPKNAVEYLVSRR